MSSTDSTSNPLDAIIDEFVARLRRGESPAIGEYAARYPEHAEAIQEMFPALVLMEQLKPDAAAAQIHGPSAVVPPETLAGRLGDYRIVREIGRGGMGIVYEAVQESLGRQVALKVLPKQAVGDVGRQARFEREARAAARLHHTNIVPVFGVGDAEGWHFFAMQYIHGLGLDEVLRELRRQRHLQPEHSASTEQQPSSSSSPDADDNPARRALSLSVTQTMWKGGDESPVETETPLGQGTGGVEARSGNAARLANTDRAQGTPAAPLSDSLALSGASHSGKSTSRRGAYWRSVARIGMQVANALQYAHDQGVLHRDIKPSNLLLDTRGTVWVTDFGLAKADDQHDLTRTGDILGTLRYMAPEVFSRHADGRSDVYSLGLTLYELLVLRPAYDESDRGRLIRLVLHESPPRLRTLDPSIPRDLETIVHKAIDREPAHRYGAASDLAADLQRFLNDEPIEAHRVSALTRGARWCRRNRLITGLTATVALLLVAAIGASLGAMLQLKSTLSERNRALVDAQQAQLQAQKETIEADAARRQANRATQQERALRKEVETQRDRAQVNFARARSTVDQYLSKITDRQLLTVPGLHSLRQELLAEALQFYGEFAREQVEDTDLQIELAKAQHRRGIILRELGQQEEAAAANADATQRLEALRDRQRGGLEVLSVLAESYYFARRYDECVALCTSLLRTYPDRVDVRSTLAESYNALATLNTKPDQLAVTLDYHQQAFAIRKQLVEKHAESAEFQAELAATLNNIGVVLDQQNRTHEALAMFELSLAYNDRACQLAPYSILWGRWDATGHHNVGRAYKQLGQQTEALRALEQLIAVRRRLVFQNPSVRPLYDDLNQALVDLGDHQKQMGRTQDAQRSYREALEVLTLIPRETAAEMFQLALLYAAQMTATDSSDNAGREANHSDEDRQHHADLALEALRQSVDMGWADPEVLKSSRVLDSLRQQAEFREVETAVTTIAEVARLLKERGKTEKETLDTRRKAAELLRQYADQNPRRTLHHGALAATWEALGETQLALGQFAEAEQSLQACQEIREQRFAASVAAATTVKWQHHSLIALEGARNKSGNVAWAQGDHAGAFRIWHESLAHLERHRVDSLEDPAASARVRSAVALAEVELANRYGSLGLFALAGEYLTRAIEHQAPPSVALHNYLVALARDGSDLALEKYLKSIDLQAVRQGTTPGRIELVRLQFLARSPTIDGELCLLMAQSYLGKSEPWPKLFLGFAQYLHDEYDKAKGTLIANYQALWQCPFALAMIEYQLGNRERAEQLLRQGEAEVRRIGRVVAERTEAEIHPPDFPRGNWWEYSHFLATRRQAWELIRQQAPPDDPWLHLVQARGYGLLGDAPKAEHEYAAALTLAPRDVDIQLAIVQLERSAGAVPARIEARWATAIEISDTDPRALIQRGRWHAERGEQERADADYARAAARTPHELNRFLEAGWWMAGPYSAELREFCPPELVADPAQPVHIVDPQTGLSATPVPWTALATGDFGRLDLSAVAGVKGDLSAYAVTHVYSPREAPATLCLSAKKPVRIWWNGELVREFDPQLLPGTWSRDMDLFPVKLRQGRNVLLVKSQIDSDLTIRLGDHPYERGMELARHGRWKEAADQLESGLRRSSDLYVHEYPFRSLAAFRLAAGERDALRRLYAELESQPNWTNYSPSTTWGLAWIGSLTAGVTDDSDLLLSRAESLRSNPDPWIRLTLPMVYARLGRWRDAFDILMEDKQLRTTDIQAAQLLALAHQKLGNTREAQTQLAKYVPTDDFLRHWSSRVPLSGVCWIWLLPREVSLAMTGSASEVDQRFEDFYRRRRAERDAFPRETLDFDAAVHRFPEHFWLWLVRGRRRAELGDFEGARADFVKAKELAPENRQVAVEYAGFLAKQGDVSSAADEFWLGLHLPDQGDWLVRGREFESQLMDQAEVLDELLRRWPDNTALNRLRGERLARLGKWEEARTSFDTGPDYWTQAAASAALSLLLDDMPGYENALARTSRQTQQLPLGSHPLQTLVECLPPRETADAQRLLTELRQREPSPTPLIQQLAVGMAEYRAGNFEQALNDLSAAMVPKQGWQLAGHAWSAQAMAHWRLGQQEEARRCLDRSSKSLELIRQATSRRQVFGGPLTQDVFWLFTLVLHRESRTLIDGPEAAAKEMAHFRNVGDLLGEEIGRNEK